MKHSSRAHEEISQNTLKRCVAFAVAVAVRCGYVYFFNLLKISTVAMFVLADAGHHEAPTGGSFRG